jgi:hypothetical protein
MEQAILGARWVQKRVKDEITKSRSSEVLIDAW